MRRSSAATITIAKKKNRARSKGATIAYLALFAYLMIGVMGVMFTGLSLVLCSSFHEVGMDWMYFALMGLLAVFLGAFGSVFNTYSGTVSGQG